MLHFQRMSMLVGETSVGEGEKKPVVEQGVDKVKKLKTKEMMLQRTSQVSLIGSLIFGFDPVNVEGNDQIIKRIRKEMWLPCGDTVMD